MNEKVKNRLEQLDDFDDDSVRKTMGLSQQEFVTKINMLNDEIKKASFSYFCSLIEKHRRADKLSTTGMIGRCTCNNVVF